MKITALVLALAAVACADLGSTKWTSDSVLPIKASLRGNWEKPPVKFGFTELGTIEVSETTKGRLKIHGSRLLVDTTNMDLDNDQPALRLSDEGLITLIDSKGRVLTKITEAGTPGTGKANGPFTGTVEEDMKFRVRNSASQVVWQFP